AGRPACACQYPPTAWRAPARVSNRSRLHGVGLSQNVPPQRILFGPRRRGGLSGLAHRTSRDRLRRALLGRPLSLRDAKWTASLWRTTPDLERAHRSGVSRRVRAPRGRSVPERRGERRALGIEASRRADIERPLSQLQREQSVVLTQPERPGAGF